MHKIYLENETGYLFGKSAIKKQYDIKLKICIYVSKIKADKDGIILSLKCIPLHKICIKAYQRP